MSQMQVSPSNASVSSNSIRVSPRHLGKMRSPTFCPCCYCQSIALGFRLPWDTPMPGIMFNMDKFEKLLVEDHFATKGSAPDWLTELELAKPVDFPAKMTEDIPEYGLTLVGMPDAVFEMEDGNICVVDYKTARYKGDSDPFMGSYEAQLWGYARLLQHHDVGRVRKAALVYFENDLADFEDDPQDLFTDKGLFVPFSVKIHEVDVDLRALDKLMKDFRAYADMETLPKSRDACKVCPRIKRMLDLGIAQRNSSKVIKDLEYKDPAMLRSILRQRSWDHREATIRESLGWEAYLTDALSVDANSVPFGWDL